MDQRKPNRKTWCSLGLTLLLCIAILVIATGTALARYRAEREEEISFSVQVPNQIHLGVVSIASEENEAEGKVEPTGETEPLVTEEVFTPNSQLAWETEAGITQLTFTVANGISESDYSDSDQRVRLRMIGTLGIWTGTQIPTLYLILPAGENGDQESVIKATTSPLIEGTPLHLAFGDGWLYTFPDEKGEEICWELPGGELSYVTLTVAIDGEVSENLSLLQPQVTAEVIQE